MQHMKLGRSNNAPHIEKMEQFVSTIDAPASSARKRTLSRQD